jgi:site-specific DNA-methyltransferase (adenine-specific)
MKEIPDGFIDLTVTSPPYDNLRTYNNTLDWGEHVWKPVLEHLLRVTKDGGVVVWVVGDATIKGSETGTSFRQALYAKEIGFNLHDTMIYTKGGQGATGSNKAYWQDFEYMFVFTRGTLSSFNPIEDRQNKVKPKTHTISQGHRKPNGETKGTRTITRKEYGRRFNVWQYHESGTRTEHPAVFPLTLAQDHILSWSNENAVVLDPFLGSGTTGVACVNLGRRFIGIEKDESYYNIAKERIAKAIEAKNANET